MCMHTRVQMGTHAQMHTLIPGGTLPHTRMYTDMAHAHRKHTHVHTDLHACTHPQTPSQTPMVRLHSCWAQSLRVHTVPHKHGEALLCVHKGALFQGKGVVRGSVDSRLSELPWHRELQGLCGVEG